MDFLENKNKGGYLQFELALLAMPVSFGELMYSAIVYGCIYLGRTKSSKLAAEVRQSRWDAMPARFKAQTQRANSDDVFALWLGAEALGFTIEYPAKTLEIWNNIWVFLDKNRERLTRLVFVRIKAELMQRFYMGSFQEDEFRALCAIYSSLGRAWWKPISSKIIGLRMRGMCKEAHMRMEEKISGRQRLSAYRINALCRKLHRLRFFARYSIGRSACYSNRLTSEALAEKIIEQRIHKVEHEKKTRDERNALMAKLRRVTLEQHGSGEAVT